MKRKDYLKKYTNTYIFTITLIELVLLTAGALIAIYITQYSNLSYTEKINGIGIIFILATIGAIGKMWNQDKMLEKPPY